MKTSPTIDAIQMKAKHFPNGLKRSLEINGLVKNMY